MFSSICGIMQNISADSCWTGHLPGYRMHDGAVCRQPYYISHSRQLFIQLIVSGIVSSPWMVIFFSFVRSTGSHLYSLTEKIVLQTETSEN